MNVHGVEVHIIHADITSLPVGALVNPADVSLLMNTGAAAGIKTNGGQEIEDQARRQAPLVSGHPAVTGAGRLKAQKIIHVLAVDAQGQTSERTIRQACADAFLCAAQLGLKSVAVPALGCGSPGFPVTASAKIIAQEILRFARSSPGPVREVILCLDDQGVFEVFEQQVTGYIRHVLEDLGKGPYVTVDIIIERPEGIVLIERSNPPFGWALPGGFVDCGESLETAAAREAKEETNLDLVNLRQFYSYSDPRRDPRFHTISTVFIAEGRGVPQSGDDAQALKVIPFAGLLDQVYAFDHQTVIADYLAKRGRL